jgi:leucyl/phenylalanyl-tRNA---protein transferase
MSVFLLTDQIIFPDVSLSEESGLLAIGGDLGICRLLSAYSLGIFPWYSEGDPIMWFSPDPRLVLFPGKFRISHSLRQKLQRKVFDVKFDHDFEKVIDQCSRIERRGQDGTWITGEMKEAYIELHKAGYAHSVETYYEGELAGGLYGVSLGGAFFGESMFHTATDASKVALYHLVEKSKEFRFIMIDSQVETDHMMSLGAELIPREHYMELLDQALKYPTRGGHW